MDIALAFIKRQYPRTVTIEPWEVYSDRIIFRVKYMEGTTVIHTVLEKDLAFKKI